MPYFCNLSTWDVRQEDQEPGIQDPPWLDSKFQTSLGCVRPVSKLRNERLAGRLGT